MYLIGAILAGIVMAILVTINILKKEDNGSYKGYHSEHDKGHDITVAIIATVFAGLLSWLTLAGLSIVYLTKHFYDKHKQGTKE
jgi:hypothetical protein